MRRMWTLLVVGICVLAVTATVLIFMRPHGEKLAGAASPAVALEPAPAPQDPQGVRWRWDDEPIAAVVAAGVGLVAVTGDGTYVGIDGSTGRRVWERKASKSAALAPVPGGRTVLTIGAKEMGAFDAFTGRRIWQADLPRSLPSLTAVTKSTVVRAEVDRHDSATALSALAVETGDEVWRYVAPAGCELATRLDLPTTASADTAFVLLLCADPAGEESTVVLALDAASGAELWQRQVGGGLMWFAAQPIGGGAVALTSRIAELELVTTAVDQRTGLDLGPPGVNIGRIEAVVPDSVDILYSPGMYRIGEPELRWRFENRPDGGPDVVSFGQLVAGFAEGCGDKQGARLVLYELGDGTRRRSVGCFADPEAVVAAPGALVVLSDGGLIGYA